MTITTIASKAERRPEVRSRVLPHERRQAHRAVTDGKHMQLIIVGHGETDWTRGGRYTGITEVGLTANGRHQAALLTSLLQRVLRGRPAVLVSSPRRRATETATLALPEHHLTVDPLVAEYDYGEFEGLTAAQIRQQAPGWDIWRDGCPDGESTADVGRRADTFLQTHTHLGRAGQPVVVVTHGHFSRILAARALRLPPGHGRLFPSPTAAVSPIEDHHGARCIGLWNADATLLADTEDETVPAGRPRPDPLICAAGVCR